MKFNLNKLPVVLLSCLLFAPVIQAASNTNIFFNASQTMTVTASNMTTIAINSGGYLFTYSQDGYFTGGVGLTNPVGRFFSVLWPNGVQAQAYTAGPLSGSGANITLKRADGKKFDLQSFTGKILLNTAGAGGAFEIMPLLNGNDAFPNPLQYDCTGYSGQSFPNVTSLIGYDTYKIHMWGDFALTALLLTDTNPVAPVSSITNTIAATASPVGAGTVGGAGDYQSNSVCTLTASPNAGSCYTFTNLVNRSLVANFVAVPKLSLAPPQANALTLTWPTNFSGFVLQRNADLATTNWVTTSGLVSIVGTNNQVTLPPLIGNGFFRQVLS
jgi:hypothetical protein